MPGKIFSKKSVEAETILLEIRQIRTSWMRKCSMKSNPKPRILAKMMPLGQ